MEHTIRGSGHRSHWKQSARIKCAYIHRRLWRLSAASCSGRASSEEYWRKQEIICYRHTFPEDGSVSSICACLWFLSAQITCEDPRSVQSLTVLQLRSHGRLKSLVLFCVFSWLFPQTVKLCSWPVRPTSCTLCISSVWHHINTK